MREHHVRNFGGQVFTRIFGGQILAEIASTIASTAKANVSSSVSSDRTPSPEGYRFSVCLGFSLLRPDMIGDSGGGGWKGVEEREIKSRLGEWML